MMLVAATASGRCDATSPTVQVAMKERYYEYHHAQFLHRTIDMLNVTHAHRGAVPAIDAGNTTAIQEMARLIGVYAKMAILIELNLQSFHTVVLLSLKLDNRPVREDKDDLRQRTYEENSISVPCSARSQGRGGGRR
jgi:hypothetical protein